MDDDVFEGPPARIVAVTSLSPSSASAVRQRQCVASWVAAGCEVLALQACEQEIARLGSYPGAVLAAEPPSTAHPGAFIPISRMVLRAAERYPDAALLLINADCELALNRHALADIAARFADGLVYLVRHEVYPDGREERHGCGVDGFLFHARFARVLPRSEVLCLGKPAHDWVTPMSFCNAKLPLYSPTFRVLLHHVHPLRWSAEEHARTCDEALRLTGCSTLDEMSRAFREATTSFRPTLVKQPPHIPMPRDPKRVPRHLWDANTRGRWE